MARLNLNEFDNQLRVPGQFEELHWPRFDPSSPQASGFWRFAVAIGLIGVLVGLLLDGFRWFLLVPLGALAAAIDAACWFRRRSQGWVGRSVTARSGVPWTITWLGGIALPLCAFLGSEALWGPWLFLSAVVLLSVFANDLALHFLHYASAHHRVAATTQEKWRHACSRWWWRMEPVTPARQGMSEADQGRFDRATRALQRYRRQHLIVLGSGTAAAFAWAIWPAGWGRPEMVVGLGLAIVALAGHAVWRVVRGQSTFRFTWLSLRIWCQSPPAVQVEAMAPWSASGPLGRTSQRRWWFGLKAALLGALIAPLVGPSAWKWVNGKRGDADGPVLFAGLATLGEMATGLRQRGWAGVPPIIGTIVLIGVVMFSALILSADYVAGATVQAAYDLLEDQHAVEHERREFAGREYRPSVVDGVSDRLRNSRSPPLRSSSLIGLVHGADPYCVLLPDELWPSGTWVLGPARSGKTHLGLNPLLAQRIRRNDGPVVDFDFKGDDVKFQSVRREAEWAGRPFIYFTNVSYFSSYLFNPLQQESLRRLTLPQLCQVLLDAFNLSHGFSYGRGHFSAQSRAGLGFALKLRPKGGRYGQGGWIRTKEALEIETFEELAECVRRAVKEHPECSGAQQLVIVVQELAEILHLNFRAGNQHLPQTAVDAAIHVPKLLTPDANGKYPVVYFYLRTGSEPVGASQIAKLFCAALKTARVQRQDDYKMGKVAAPPPNVALFMDEWHHVADDAMRNMLEQGGGLGIHFVLANQDISQLDRDDREYLQTVWENCGNKLIFGARDVQFQDLLIKSSGETTVHAAIYQVAQRDVLRGDVDVAYAMDQVEGKEVGVQIQEQRGPRFHRNVIIEMSNDPRRFLFIPARGASVADYGGYPIMVNGEFLFSKEDYDALAKLPWPAPSAETVIPETLRKIAAPRVARTEKDGQKGLLFSEH